MDYFEGKVALASGASRGVGFATARRLVERGARVVITARGVPRLLDSRAKLGLLPLGGSGYPPKAGEPPGTRCVRSRVGGGDVMGGVEDGAKVEAVAGDVARFEDAERMVGAALARFGRLEHLIAARGHVIFVSSVAGLFGLPGASAYCASKGALTPLAESLRAELGDLGVHVGVAHLGFTEHDPEKRILEADGTPVPPDRPAHHTQVEAAALILDMIEKRKDRLVMTAIGRLGSIAHRLSPAALEQAVRWARRRRIGLYQRFA